MLAKTSSLLTAAVLVAFTAAENATTSLPPNLLGYYQMSGNDAWFKSACNDGSEFTSTGGYARCCSDTSNCEFVVACPSGTPSFVNGFGKRCSYGCKTVTIYDSPANDKPAERILCDNSAGVSTLYRHTTTPMTATPGPSITTSSPTSTVTSTSTSTEPPETKDPESSSQAWIAGAVIGPVAGCAIIAALGFWVFRRRRARKQAEAASAQLQQNPAMAAPYDPKPDGQPPSELPTSYYGQNQKHSDRPLSELPTS